MKSRANYNIFLGGIILANAVFIFSQLSIVPIILRDQALSRQQLNMLRTFSAEFSRKRPPADMLNAAPDNLPVIAPAAGSEISLETIRVKGIVQGKNPVVFLEFGREKTSGIFREGDIAAGFRICEIRRESVVFSDGQRRRILRVALDGAEEAFCRQISENEIVFNKKMLGTTALKLAGEANGLKIIPAGGPQRETGGGLRISNIAQGGIMEELGLKNNDVICLINGVRVDNLFALMNAAQKIKSAGTAEIHVQRNNLPLVLKYSVR